MCLLATGPDYPDLLDERSCSDPPQNYSSPGFQIRLRDDCRARVEGNGFDVGILGILGILRILRSPAAAPSKQAASGRFLEE